MNIGKFKLQFTKLWALNLFLIAMGLVFFGGIALAYFFSPWWLLLSVAVFIVFFAGP